MDKDFRQFSNHKKVKPRSNRGGLGQTDPKNSDFVCAQCRAFVSSASFLSGVNHRNHCPYCLWSRHLDLYTAGDRLSVCRGKMKPVGLAVKKTRKKYGPGQSELMLVHCCEDCGKTSLNRIAADDFVDQVLQVYQESLTSSVCTQVSVEILHAADFEIVQAGLFGKERALVL